MKLKTFAAVITAACGLTLASSAFAKLNIIPVTLDVSTGTIDLPAVSFIDTGLNKTTGAVTTLEAYYTFSLPYSTQILSATLDGTSKNLPTKYKGFTVLDPSLEGTFTLYSGKPAAGMMVTPEAGGTNGSAILVTPDPGPNYNYYSSIGYFLIPAGEYYLQVDYAYNPNYSPKANSYLSLPAAGAIFNGTAAVAAAPEASTWAMLGLGFAGVGLMGVAKRRKDSRYAF
jgi:hypothetical protein